MRVERIILVLEKHIHSVGSCTDLVIRLAVSYFPLRLTGMLTV